MKATESMRRADKKFADFFRDFLKPPAQIDTVKAARRILTGGATSDESE